MAHINRNMVMPLYLFVPVLLSVFLLFSTSSFASDVDSTGSPQVEIFYFYETGCSSCEKLEEFFEQYLEPNYPVAISKYEIHEPNNANLMLDMAEAYNEKEIIAKGTPAVFVGDKAFQGDSKETLKGIEEAVRVAIGSKAPSPLGIPQQKGREQAAGGHEGKKVGLTSSPQKEGIRKQLTILAVLGAAALDSVNPCEWGVLTLLLSTMLIISRSSESNVRSRVINAGLAFTAATYICYFLMGMGLFTAIRVAGIQHYIYLAVSILSIVVGLWNTKDFFWYEGGMNIEVPQSWRPLIKRITRGVTSAPGAFVIGCFVSVLLLPCTSGPYVVIIGMLSNTATRMQAVCWLLIYNVIFVLPFIIITLCVGFGLSSPAIVEKLRLKWLRRLHLATGIFMLALGVAMIVLLIIGII